jgi:tetrahydromethanopterin S-methyltransferase subunit G
VSEKTEFERAFELGRKAGRSNGFVLGFVIGAILMGAMSLAEIGLRKSQVVPTVEEWAE